MLDILNIGKFFKVYRNYLLCVISIIVLDVVVISGCYIMKVFGYKLEILFRFYFYFIISDGKKREILEIFSKFLDSNY